jgi:hypothetical protein
VDTLPADLGIVGRIEQYLHRHEQGGGCSNGGRSISVAQALLLDEKGRISWLLVHPFVPLNHSGLGLLQGKNAKNLTEMRFLAIIYKSEL